MTPINAIKQYALSLFPFLSFCLVEPVDSRPNLDRGIPTRPGWCCPNIVVSSTYMYLENQMDRV